MESVESHGILRGSIYLPAGQWKSWKVLAFFEEASIFQQDNGNRVKSWHFSRKHLSSSRSMESGESHGILRGSIYLPAGQWKAWKVMAFFEEASIFQQDNGKRGKSWHSSRKHLSSSRTMESVESHGILRGSIYLPAGQWKAWKVMAFFEEASIFEQDNGKSWHFSRKHLSSSRTMESVEVMAFFDEASIFQQDNGKRGKSWHSSRKHLSSSRTMESVESHGIFRGSIYLPAGQWKAGKVMAFFEEASIFQQDNGKRGKSWHSSRKHLSSSRTMESVESHGILRGSIYLRAGQWKAWKVMAFFEEASIFQQDNGKRGKSWHSSRKHLSSSRTMESHGIFRGSIYRPAGQWKAWKSWHSSMKHLSSSRTMESVESHGILRGSIYLPAGQWKAWKVMAFFEEASIFEQDNGKRGKSWHFSRKHISSSRTMESVESLGIFRGSIYLRAGQWKALKVMAFFEEASIFEQDNGKRGKSWHSSRKHLSSSRTMEIVESLGILRGSIYLPAGQWKSCKVLAFFEEASIFQQVNGKRGKSWHSSRKHLSSSRTMESVESHGILRGSIYLPAGQWKAWKVMAFFEEASIFEQDNGKRGKSWHSSRKHLSSSRTMESVESHGILRGSIYLRAGQWKVMAFFEEASIVQQDNGKRGSHGILR